MTFLLSLGLCDFLFFFFLRASSSFILGGNRSEIIFSKRVFFLVVVGFFLYFLFYFIIFIFLFKHSIRKISPGSWDAGTEGAETARGKKTGGGQRAIKK